MWEYSEKVRDHFNNPRNVGELPDANGVGEVGSIACGDALRLYLKVDDNDRIADARFQTFGCGSAIASASALTEMIKGLTIDEAVQLSNQDIADYLGGLPKEKMHCSVMGREALEAAVRNLRGGPAGRQQPEEDEGTIVCQCFGITDQKIRRVALENGLREVEDITAYTKAGGGCTACLPQIEDLLRDLWAEQDALASAGPKAPRPLTNLERIDRIKEVIAEEIRPALQQDGGDIRLVDIDGAKVAVRLSGTCRGCALSQVTLTDYVQARLRELVDREITVEERP